MADALASDLRGMRDASTAGRSNSYTYQPLPNDLDEVVGKFIDTYQTLPAAERTRQRASLRLDLQDSRILLAYGERMATLALRRHDQAPILRGLLAVMLEAGDEDWRESMITLALLHDAATRLGLDPAQVFALAAASAHSTEIRDRFLRFLNRSERNKSAEGMRYILVEGPEGPAYRPDPSYWRTTP